MSNNVLHFTPLVKSYFLKAWREKSAAGISHPCLPADRRWSVRRFLFFSHSLQKSIIKPAAQSFFLLF